MRLLLAIAAFLLAAPLASAQLPAPALDTSTPLGTRVGGEIPARMVEMFARMGQPALKTYTPTAVEKQKVAAALALLTPLQRSVAQKHLRSITFADSAPFNAQTNRSGQGDDFTADVVINRIVFGETVSDFLTRKDRQLFDTTGSTLSVSIDAGKMDAVDFVLLHEFTHMTDMLLKLTPQAMETIPEGAHTNVTRGVWQTMSRLAEPYNNPILGRVSFAPNARTIPVAEAHLLYEALGHTPIVSVYGSRVAIEDLPELLAAREMEKLHQPYRVEVRDGSKVVYTFEPLKNPLIRARFSLLARFDSADLQ